MPRKQSPFSFAALKADARGAVSGLDLSKEPAPGTKPPEMPKVKMTMKKQPFYRFVCNWKLTQKKKCGTVIPGPTSNTVDYSAKQHWNKHLRENGFAELA